MSNSLNQIKAHVQAGRFGEAVECFKRVDHSSLPLEARLMYALSLTRLGEAPSPRFAGLLASLLVPVRGSVSICG